MSHHVQDAFKLECWEAVGVLKIKRQCKSCAARMIILVQLGCSGIVNDAYSCIVFDAGLTGSVRLGSFSRNCTTQ